MHDDSITVRYELESLATLDMLVCPFLGQQGLILQGKRLYDQVLKFKVYQFAVSYIYANSDTVQELLFILRSFLF